MSMEEKNSNINFTTLIFLVFHQKHHYMALGVMEYKYYLVKNWTISSPVFTIFKTGMEIHHEDQQNLGQRNSCLNNFQGKK